MNLEPVIQSGISQKTKYNYRVLMHIYEIKRMALICRAGLEVETQNRLWTQQRREGGTNREDH